MGSVIESRLVQYSDLKVQNIPTFHRSSTFDELITLTEFAPRWTITFMAIYIGGSVAIRSIYFCWRDKRIGFCYGVLKRYYAQLFTTFICLYIY